MDRHIAVGLALDRAEPGDLVVMLADHDEVQRVVDQWRDDDLRRSDKKSVEIRNG